MTGKLSLLIISKMCLINKRSWHSELLVNRRKVFWFGWIFNLGFVWLFLTVYDYEHTWESWWASWARRTGASRRSWDCHWARTCCKIKQFFTSDLLTIHVHNTAHSAQWPVKCVLILHLILPALITLPCSPVSPVNVLRLLIRTLICIVVPI